MTTTSQATISGPVSGGQHGWPFGAPDAVEIEKRGYVMEEFFLEGEAQSYKPAAGTTTGEDGHWQVEPDVRAPFKTRFYVVRPRDPSRFNGVVLVNWQNVTANIDLGWPQDDENYRGYAWVGVTTQKIGIDGVPDLTKGLTAWDSERYASLHHPGDAYCYDIVTQAARAVGKDRSIAGIDPLGGLKPKIMIAMGGSQSAMRLGSYINIAQARDRVFDGFLLTVHWGMCPPLPDVSLQRQFKPVGNGRYLATAKINDTTGTPILVLTGESEALHNYPVRQPDTDTFRFWEMAGAAHSGPEMMDSMNGMFARDGLATNPPYERRNTVEWNYVRAAALRRLVEWVRDGKAPASMPRLEIEAGEKPQIKRDRMGNALGGIRLPEVAAPLAAHHGANDKDPMTALAGETRPFDAAQLHELYPTTQEYLGAWNRAVDALAEAGLVLAEDEAPLRARGEAFAAQI